MAPFLLVTKSSPPSGGGLRKEAAGKALIALLMVTFKQKPC